MDVQERILTRASELFGKYGVKSVSMDDLAGELGISKKTIYQYFSNKAELVQAFTQAFFNHEVLIANQLNESAENAVQALIMAIRQMQSIFKEISPRLIYEIQKYYPQSWALFESFKQNILYPLVYQNLEEGITQGYYRKDIHMEIVARMRVNQMELAIRQELYPYKSFDPAEVQLELFRMYMHGIVTEKGRQHLHKYLASHPEDEELLHINNQ
ncbi:MAG: TetR/AcrR family transcriptional regulator [Bacteroidota bacterium]